MGNVFVVFRTPNKVWIGLKAELETINFIFDGVFNKNTFFIFEYGNELINTIQMYGHHIKVL